LPAVWTIVMAGKQARVVRQLQNPLNLRQSLSASPPGKSARAVPESGMNTASCTKAASSMT
jgi:hypothetical protein